MSHVPTEGTKVCRRCGQEKHVTRFRTFMLYGAKDREYRRSWCETCDRSYLKQWWKDNPTYHAEWAQRQKALG